MPILSRIDDFHDNRLVVGRRWVVESHVVAFVLNDSQGSRIYLAFGGRGVLPGGERKSLDMIDQLRKTGSSHHNMMGIWKKHQLP